MLLYQSSNSPLQSEVALLILAYNAHSLGFTGADQLSQPCSFLHLKREEKQYDKSDFMYMKHYKACPRGALFLKPSIECKGYNAAIFSNCLWEVLWLPTTAAENFLKITRIA
ncbi:hypothetical protein AVEN_38712-1 [Araneus ventricosus]|uniref:Uncharacterized protein n=1 Tax=Araneus ventricosus TaxID=182803 RepID=A0A4Y2GRH1_ARAVE|nr:hypothetical protein AVEN_38712-1 [Araneus ventricosus]